MSDTSTGIAPLSAEALPPINQLARQVDAYATADEWLDLLTEAIVEATWPQTTRPSGIPFVDADTQRRDIKRQANLAALRHSLRTEDDIATGALIRHWLKAYCRKVARQRYPYAEDDE